MVIHINNRFNIGEHVYHVTPESDKGVILDINIKAKNGAFTYLVTFGRFAADTVECEEEELSKEKKF